MTELVSPEPMPVSRSEPNEHVHIEPTSGWVSLQFKDLWRYRELLYFLIWRDVKVRYKQTALGVFWAIIQPVMSMLVLTLFFGQLAKMDSEGYPHAIFYYAAILPWNYFSAALTQTSGSLVGNANLITKVYFPRLVIPISSAVSGLVDFGISFLVMIVLMFFFPVHPNLTGILFIPLFLLLALTTALGIGLWLSALNVQYRDIRYIVPFLTQFWMYASPVVYSSRILDEPWRTFYGLNPLVGVIDGFRWALLGANPPGASILVSAAMSILLLVSGVFYFRRMEKNFADII